MFSINPSPHVMRCAARFNSRSISFPADLLPLIEGHGLQPHLYSDDTQTYGFCSPSASPDLQRRICVFVDEVAAWMRSNRLQLNTTKTEILWSTTGRRLQQPPLRVGPDQIVPATVVRDLGIYLDSDVSVMSPVAKTVVLLCGTASAAEHPLVSVQIRPPVLGVVSSSPSTGLR